MEVDTSSKNTTSLSKIEPKCLFSSAVTQAGMFRVGELRLASSCYVCTGLTCVEPMHSVLVDLDNSLELGCIFL